MKASTYQLRHAGSPKVLEGISLHQVAEGLRDARWEVTDEVRAQGEIAWQTLEEHPHFAELVEEMDSPDLPHHEEPTHLDMNALIDVCLVLLIFFILTTTYALSVQRVVPAPPGIEDPEKKGPEAAKGKEGKKVRTIKREEIPHMVRVRAYKDEKGKTVIQVGNIDRDVLDSEGAIDREKLAAVFREVKKEVEGNEILLDARDISWGAFIGIQDAAHSAGIEKINHLAPKGP